MLLAHRGHLLNNPSMKRFFSSLLVSASLLTLLACSSAEKHPLGVTTSQVGDVQFEPLLADGDPPAMAVREIDHGQVTHQFFGGKRSIQFDELITPEDKWHLGSCTKPMTSYLIGTLMDEGKLTLDSRLADLLPGYLPKGSGLAGVKVRDLLTHRAGLTEVNQIRDTKAWTDTFTSREPARKQRERLVKAILQEPPRFRPGSKFEYSNSAYVVLGEIIARLNNQEWEQVLTAKVFEPLKMKGCGFGPSATKGASPPDQPWGHTESNGKLITVQPYSEEDESSTNPTASGPSGIVHCDFDSWSAFLTEMLNASKGHSALLKPATARKLFSPYKDGVAVGGWGAKRRDWAQGLTYTMSGSNGLNYALFVIAPEKDAVYMAAANSGTGQALHVLTEALKPLTK